MTDSPINESKVFDICEFLAELRHIWMPCGLQAIDLKFSWQNKLWSFFPVLCFKSRNYNQFRSAFSIISFSYGLINLKNKTQWWTALPIVFFEMRGTRLTALVVPSTWCLTSCFGSQDILAIGFWDKYSINKSYIMNWIVHHRL